MSNRDEEIYENLKEGKINVVEMHSPPCLLQVSCLFLPQDLYTHYLSLPLVVFTFY